MLAIPVAAVSGVALATPIALKALGELHRHTVLQSNVLSRQGNGTPALPGDGDKLARQRAAGIKGGLVPAQKDPAYMGKVPNRPLSGDTRKHFGVGRLGNATSSRGTIIDQLLKVPRRNHGGSADYKKAARSEPSRKAGFDNQVYTP